MKKTTYILFFVMHLASIAQAPKTISQLKTEFDIALSSEFSRFDGIAKNGHQGDHYHMKSLQGLAMAFQATKDYAYLEQAITWMHDIKGTAALDSSFPTDRSNAIYSTVKPGNLAFFSNGILSWNNHKDRVTGQGHTNGGETQLFCNHGLKEAYYVLLVMHQNEEVRLTPNGRGGTYQDDYDVLLDFYEQSVYLKWQTPTIDGGRGKTFSNTTHTASHPAFMLECLAIMRPNDSQYENKKDLWLDDSSSFSGIKWPSEHNGFKSGLRPHPSTVGAGLGEGYIWASTFGATSGATDMHANAELKLVALQRFLRPAAWSATDMQKFAATVEYCVDVGNANANDFPGVLNGTYGGEFEGHYGSGLMAMGAFSPSLQLKLEYRNEDREAALYYKLSAAGYKLFNRAYLNGFFDSDGYPHWKYTAAESNHASPEVRRKIKDSQIIGF